MLCIGRRLEEKIVIGDGDSKIVITVIRIDKNQVKLGFDAPPNISVHREEIYRVIKRAGGNLLFGSDALSEKPPNPGA